MSTLRSAVYNAGKTDEAIDADTQIVSGTIQNGSGSLSVNAQATSILMKVAGTTVLTVAPAGATLAQPLAMGGNKITNVAVAGNSGDGLAYPWLGAINGMNTLGGTYTIVHTDGTWDDTGLSVTLPSSGTYLVWYQARTSLNISAGAGAVIVTKMYNATSGADVANSEQIGAVASTLNISYYGTPTVLMTIQVAGARVISLYVKIVNNSSTYVIKTVNTDTNGRTSMGYFKINDT